MQLRPLPAVTLNCKNKVLDLSVPQVMGILNVTPDSFSDGGQYTQLEYALNHAKDMVRQGASIIDIGGESTRPHAAKVGIAQELQRVVPVVKAISQQLDVIISIDTSTPEVMQAAVDAGAHLWNDVRALTRPKALEMAASLNVPVILMHMRGEPDTMNSLANYDNVVHEVINELEQRVNAALTAGIARDHIILDPGFGFAKNAQHNLKLLNSLYQFNDYFGLPWLSGLSRKRFLGEVLNGANVNDRLYAGLAGHLLSVQQGASIVRTHDVLATVQHLKLWQASLNA
ncbi:dihydropteroate synthase [Alkanindiges hydrocarboniclasticus]|jgi:dihydropteroate synthase|uniref:Dihydropteroate synthase n=1 Tax=Alkanindiges hydrocarboniclasticus TaxID=1907941 RepID=A0A1S8CTZ1_9GAMM|nr:dihydropteroate synthase [Alkanindiges hydrocarboniclasticus]ONG39505.1 dihydropteroate synthase [Alkanindiges hydrocarboniclasticus]